MLKEVDDTVQNIRVTRINGDNKVENLLLLILKRVPKSFLKIAEENRSYRTLVI